jgi:biotin operon repressor
MMNGYFGLSKREAEIYSFIVKLDSEWRPVSDKDYKDILSTSNRKLIIRECNINKTNLSRLIIDLRNRGLVVFNADGGYELPSKLAINPSEKIIETVFTFEVVDDEGTG